METQPCLVRAALPRSPTAGRRARLTTVVRPVARGRDETLRGWPHGPSRGDAEAAVDEEVEAVGAAVIGQPTRTGTQAPTTMKEPSALTAVKALLDTIPNRSSQTNQHSIRSSRVDGTIAMQMAIREWCRVGD
jgi:hypothetical protein